MAKWHDENPAKAEMMTLLAAVGSNFEIANKYYDVLSKAIDRRYVRCSVVYELTERGEAQYQELVREYDEASKDNT